MDALASFTHLTDSLPLWLSKLETLSAQVAEQHAKFSRLTATTEFRMARRKTGSTESLQPQEKIDDKANSQSQTLVQDNVASNADASVMDITANDVLAMKDAWRKRKPGSALSAASGPQKYRNRTMVIVYYNSDIQDAFEHLVRNIAGARNNLRKGRTAATFKARMASLSMNYPLFSAGGEQDHDSKPPRPPKKARQEANEPSPTFETIDKELENAQISCEKAAHQVLRDGDCKEELLGIKNNFQNSLQLAKKEEERLRAVEAQEAVDKALSEEPVVIHIEEKPASPVVKAVEYGGMGAIEVDDGSDAESIHLDLSAIRRARKV